MDQQSPHGRVSTWLAQFADALEKGDGQGVSRLFAPTCYWRDLVALTWNIKTVEGRDDVADLVSAAAASQRPHGWEIDGDVVEADGVAEAWLRFETKTVRGVGHLRLGSDGAITLLTTADEIKGHEERRGRTRDAGVRHGVEAGRRTWAERRADEEAALGRDVQPFVVIVGGGQGGIALSARLRMLGVHHVVLEKNDRPGDSWRNRYKSLHLHDPVWYDHLPYIPFPDHWPVFSPKDKLGDWLESYVNVMELPYWANSKVKRAAYDGEAGTWTVEIDRDGEAMTLRPEHLVLATGMSAVPNMPELPGMEDFEGDLHHSSRHPGPDAYAGKKAVVVGSNNSAHDICAALYEAGADVTMLQRSSTHISRSETLMDLALGGLYSEEAVANGITTQRADLIFASIPYGMLPSVQKAVADGQKERDAAFYERLEKAGFKLDFGDDDTGLFMKYLRRGSGYYIDVGASDLIADGKIKLAHGQVTEVVADGLVLEDDTHLAADVIVFATGYGSMNGWAAQLISQEVADKVGKCWGLGSGTTKDPGPWEGELRNMWKPTRQEGLWFHGGNLHQSRHYSQYLAIQLKARAEGIETPVYGLQEVHHLA